MPSLLPVLLLVLHVDLGITLPSQNGTANGTSWWLGELFEQRRWHSSALLLSPECLRHLDLYHQGLETAEPWAEAMYDASGRYAGQFMFGNNFWLGSGALCSELRESPDRAAVTPPLRKPPPFPVSFSVAHVSVHQSPARVLHVGLCLPASCLPRDLQLVLGADAASIAAPVTVEAVRRVPGDYDIFRDLKFHIVGGVALLVTLIVIIASGLELHLNSATTASTTVLDTDNNNKDNPSAPRHLAIRIVLCFSAVGNARRIMQTAENSTTTTSEEDNNVVRCVHGLRVISILWIVLVHTYLEVFAVADNKGLRRVTERSFYYQTVSNASFSVDTFFFISGLLLAHSYCRTGMAAKDSTAPLVSRLRRLLVLVGYRCARLWPAYMWVLGAHEVSMRHYHSASVFEPELRDYETCTHYWWRNALFINTWWPQTELCMLWSWYLAVDTQLYAVAACLLVWAGGAPWRAKGPLLTGALLVSGSWAAVATLAALHGHTVRVEEPFALFDQLYDKPWLRAGPYAAGLCVGATLAEGRLVHTVRRIVTPLISALLWVASAAVACLLVYGVGSGLDLYLAVPYAALGHTAWGCALAWLVMGCTAGRVPSPIARVLQWPPLAPLSRLTYCAYLVHPALMCITSFQVDGPLHLHNGLVFVLYLGNVVAAFSLSFLVSLGFEAPIVRLLKLSCAPKQTSSVSP